MIISAKLIKKSKTLRKCEECGHYLEPGSSILRLYGMAEQGDPPYVIFLHPCGCKYGARTDPKILVAVAKPLEKSSETRTE